MISYLIQRDMLLGSRRARLFHGASEAHRGPKGWESPSFVVIVDPVRALLASR
jgi:hypothetical protein